MSDHYLHATISPEDGPHLEVVCNAPDTAPCHQVSACPECEAEGCANCDRYGKKLVDFCNPLEWIDHEGGAAELFNGPIDTPLRSGPVRLVWDGDYYVWEYEHRIEEDQ